LAADADSEAARHNVEDGAPSSVLAAVADNMTTSGAASVVDVEDAVSVGETTSPNVTAMLQFRSSLSGLSWRRLTFLVWAS
jgi:hypothetical protein